MAEVQECNAVIESVEIRIDRGFCLCPWVHLKFNGGGCGFGGFMVGHSDRDNLEMPGYCAEFLIRCMAAGGVESWSRLAGKNVRVRHTGLGGGVDEIGHILDDDKWFNPKKAFADKHLSEAPHA